MKPSWKHRAEYLLLWASGAVLTRLPERVAMGLASMVGWLAGSVLRIRRRTVDDNLEHAFPRHPRGWRRRVARRTYRHFAREVVTLFRFMGMDAAEVRSRCEIEGIELFEGPIARGKGAIALIGHLGNWEIAGVSVTSRGIPVHAVVRRQKNPLVDGYVERARKRLGMDVIDREKAPRQIPRRLREPSVVAIVGDQNAPRGGLFVDFFGRRAATARGPGVLVLRTGVPAVFADCKRLSGSKARYRLRLEPAVLDSSSDLETSVQELTRAYMAHLEHAIREDPEQYFWFHKRWKTRPDGPTGGRP